MSTGFMPAASTSTTSGPVGSGCSASSGTDPCSRRMAARMSAMVRIALRPARPGVLRSAVPMDDAAIAYDAQGLVPCVIQDWDTGEVLTLAYMNAEALERTRATGELHLWSRSRQELWHKGATSGNTQAVRAIRYDCDGDALLALVEPAGPACHTGERTCFHRGELEPAAPHEVLPGLERTIAARRRRAHRGLLHGDAARRPRVRGREGGGGGRGGRPRGPRGERRARRRGGRRRPLPPRGARRTRAASTSPTPTRCCVPVAAESELSSASRPALEEVRALAERGHNLVPVVQTYLEDCETPVSAFLKLRGAGPAFLLESAEQGQRVGRWSFIGYRPRSVVRWELADGGDPYALAAAEAERHRQAPIPGLPPFAGGAVGFFGYDCVRTVEPLGPPNPDTIGLPDLALMLTDALVAFDHLKHTVTILANAYVEEDGVEAGYERARALDRRGARAARRPAAAARGRRRRRAGVHAEHAARGVRGDGRPDRRVRPRGRRLPGRAVAALDRRRRGRPVLRLPRPARDQPVAVHVLPRLRGLPDRRRLARAARDRLRRPRDDPPDRRHPPARRRRRRGRGDRRRPARRREGARRARDARRPRPQRPRPGVRVRHASRSRRSWPSRPTRT